MVGGKYKAAGCPFFVFAFGGAEGGVDFAVVGNVEAEGFCVVGGETGALDGAAEYLGDGPGLAAGDVGGEAGIWVCVILGFVAEEGFVGDGAGDGVVAGAFGAFCIEDHVDGLLHFDAALRAVAGAHFADVDCHGLPGCVEEFVAIEQAGDARFAFAREELEERGEVLCADNFPREGPMEEVQVVQ